MSIKDIIEKYDHEILGIDGHDSEDVLAAVCRDIRKATLEEVGRRAALFIRESNVGSLIKDGMRDVLLELRRIAEEGE